MKPEHYQRLYNIVALVLVFYSVNTYLSSQGVEAFLDIKLLDERRVPGAVFGFFICAVLLLLLLVIARKYARMSTGTSWHSRLPVLYLDNLDFDTSSSLTYQRISVGLVMVLPQISIVHFMNIIFEADILIKSGEHCPVIGLGLINCPDSVAQKIAEHTVRIGHCYSEGVEWFPVLEPIVIIVLQCGVLWAAFSLHRELTTTAPSLG